MRRVLKLWAIAITLLALVGPGTAGALGYSAIQDGAIANTSNPEVGDTVSYITESGSEVAQLRASEVIMEWEDFSEYYVPSPGSQYVVIVVEITNLGSRGNMIVRADDFRLQDVDGFFYSRSWADASETSELIPAESEIGIAPGATEDVVLVYEVLSGVELSHLFWQPEYERLLTIADLDEYVPGQG